MSRRTSKASGAQSAVGVPGVVIQAPSSGPATERPVSVPTDLAAPREVQLVHPNDALCVLLQFVEDNRHLMHR